jgi:GAF domain-containing protein
MYNSDFNKIKRITKNLDLETSLNSICSYLQSTINGYDWVGFYFHNEIKKELELKAYSGIPTQHTKIPYGKGICGQTAESNKHMIVADVLKESNYISCNVNVKSEIVVPIFLKNINVGQIDIDSNIPNRFSEVDLEFLTRINSLVSEKLLK